jgi:uncharacterized protein YndB with AHSA1/START domain
MSEATAGALTLSLPSDLEIEISRVLDATRERVWEAWTLPDHVREWWGQKDSTLAVCEIDLRAGGAWRFVERAADGNEYPFKGEYREVAPPERLVHTFIFDVEPFNARGAVVTVTFEDVDGKTRVTEKMRFETMEDRDGMLQSGMETGAAESYERLGALLARLA